MERRFQTFCKVPLARGNAAAWETSADEEVRDSVLVDISSSGVRLQLDRELPVGSVLRVELRPHPAMAFNVPAEVVWTRPSWTAGVFQMGLRFQADSRRLLDLV
jgi:hypothetical protein